MTVTFLPQLTRAAAGIALVTSMAACSADKGGSSTAAGASSNPSTGGSAGSSGSAGSGATSPGLGSFTTPPPTGGAQCGDGEPATVLFVVDRSGSMNCNLPPITTSSDCEATPTRIDPSQPSKWEVVSQVMGANLASLIPKTAGAVPVAAGISYFSRDNACGTMSTPNVEVAPMNDAQVQVMQTSLYGQTPEGETPIVGGLMTAYQHLHQELKATGNRYVVLITDGSDPCQDKYAKMMPNATNPDGTPIDFLAELVNVYTPNALIANIRTFVVGAPGSENNARFLSALAVAGGTAPKGCDPNQTACHFDTTQGSFQDQFQKAMEQITATVSCPPPA